MLRYTILLVLLTLATSLLYAQQPCDIAIVGDFESRCVIPEKVGSVEELDADLVACQGMTVNYTVMPVPTGANPPQWTWSVTGEDSYTDHGDGTLTVTWGTGPAGQLSVTDGQCTRTRRVRLVAPPEVHAVSTPSYTVDALGQKVITLCAGSPLTFTDSSIPTDGNGLAGVFWQCSAGTASTESFTIGAVMHGDIVTHRVYNHCGCYDEEQYNVVQGDTLGLGCYGTVCENATVTYTATNPVTCSTYMWYVEGGTIVDGQNTPSVTVQWDRPQDGYGVIALDGDLCGGSACPALLSRRIPVVQDRLPIEGPATVCVGATEEYSLPLFAATEYTWSVTPSADVQTYPVNGANKMRLVFEEPGVYTIKVTYDCDILGCGPYESETLTVTVQEPLLITGRNRICFHDACALATSPVAAVTWSVRDMDAGTDLPALTATGATFSTAAFPHAGRYRITAESPLHCRPAAFLLTVEALPPQVAVADLDPDNPDVSCPHSSIRLEGSPADPRYTLLWMPACTTATPSMVSANQATVNYGAEVCDVNVYLFDRVTGCRSETPYVHTVAPFALASLANSLPGFVTACPGSLVSFGNSHVPWQKGVLYRWELEQSEQRCASIQGDATSNTANIQLNILPTPPHAHTFHVYLIRDWCGGADTHSVEIKVTDTIPPANITVTPDPATLCPNGVTNLTATGCGSQYLWSVNNSVGIPDGSSWQWGSGQSGTYTVRAACSSYDYCDNEAYFASGTALVTVTTGLPYTGLEYDVSTGDISLVPFVAPCPNCTYQWTVDDMAVFGATPYIDCRGEGIYACTVTDGLNNCTATYTLNVTVPCSGDCVPLAVWETDFDYCTGILSMQAASPFATSWMVDGGEYENISTVTANTATVQLKSVGTYHISAYNGNLSLCEAGQFTKTVEFLPDFGLEASCTTIVVHNQSQYLDGTRTVTVTLRSHASGLDIDSYTFQLSSDGCHFNPSLGIDDPNNRYDLYLTDYGGTPLDCFLGTVSIVTNGSNQLTIITSNTLDQTHTCDNIPIKLTATLRDGVSVASVHWAFGDGSQLESNGNNVFHTYGKSSPLSYLLSATATDEYGCQYSGSLNITSVGNTLIGNDQNHSYIHYDNPEGCPYVSSQELYFNNRITDNPNGTYLWWWSSGNATGIPFYAFFTDNYYVRVRDANYCLAEAMMNVPFLQGPTVTIVPDETLYCVDDELFFHGAPGPDSNQYTYVWSITIPSNPPQTVPLQATTATVSYTPQQSGTYTLYLRLTNSDGCSDITSFPFLVNAKPAPPTVSYNGNRCIHTPPVVLQGGGSSAGLYHWSCGDYGHDGYYFYPGRATAYYYDPATGCRSDTAGLTIEPAPDMDAVLSGCYELCTSIDELRVWGITTFDQVVGWKWFRDGSGIDNGQDNFLSHPLTLPIPGPDRYYLRADYGGSCSVFSAPLDITQTDYCPCDSLEVKYTVTPLLKNCQLKYHITVTVTNLSLRTRCLSSVAWIDMANGNNMSTDFISQTLAPSGNYVFNVTLTVNELPPFSATLRITDDCQLCVQDIILDLTPNIPCHTSIGEASFTVNTYLASTVAAYFDLSFDLTLGGVPPDALLGFWCEPPMVVNYLYSSPYVQGLGMLDPGRLAQMAQQGEQVCFYALTCTNNILCLMEYCIKASELLDLLYPSNPREFPEKRKGAQTAVGAASETEVVLNPNPTTGNVEVTGAGGVVEEVLVMDMYGRQAARFEGTGTFDVRGLPSGSYIVRIKAVSPTGTKVYYRKLIKK